MTHPDALLSLSIAAVGQRIHRGTVHSADLVAAAQDRIARLNPALNAVLQLRPEAPREALEIDRRHTTLPPASVLAGIPLAHKDMFFRSREVTTFGAHRSFWQRATSTCAVKERLDQCGAIDLATLNMAEFAAGPTGENAHHGRCRNPWAPERLSGGSSSGSAAAVAARLVFGSIGSDTGGSIRVPAALCGVTGLKPTTGRVSSHGAMTRVWTQDSIGPIARSAEDCSLLLAAIAGPDHRDPLCARDAAPFQHAATAPQPLRIGVLEALIAEAESDTGRCIDAALRELAGHGAALYARDWSDIDAVHTLTEIAHKAESTALHDTQLRAAPDHYGAATRLRLEEGMLIPAVRYLQALSMRPIMAERFINEALKDCDVVALPTVACEAPYPPQHSGDSAVQGRLLARLTRYTKPFNYLGLPALTVPCGFGSTGLPVGLQFVARPFCEAQLIAIGRFYQRLTDWHDHCPELAAMQEKTTPHDLG